MNPKKTGGGGLGVYPGTVKGIGLEDHLLMEEGVPPIVEEVVLTVEGVHPIRGGGVMIVGRKVIVLGNKGGGTPVVLVVVVIAGSNFHFIFRSI